MPEAVIVAAARTPIGRAFKGSLKDLRPDDLAAFIKTAPEKVPQLDPEDIDDLMLGCGLRGGEQGFNMARVVAVLLGYDHLPGVTLTRYCASSLQTDLGGRHVGPNIIGFPWATGSPVAAFAEPDSAAPLAVAPTTQASTTPPRVSSERRRT